VIAVTFALPDESRDLVARLRHPQRGSNNHHLASIRGELAGREILIIHTGVGAADDCHARLATSLAQQSSSPPLSALICAGFAGGLRADVRAGDLILGENFSDPRLLSAARQTLVAAEKFPWHVGALTTELQTVETAAGKAALHARRDGALAVDMESAWIAAACARAGVPVLSLRVISDGATDDFPVPASVIFDQKNQRPRAGALLLWLLRHPQKIAPFARFVRGLDPARRRLADALEKVVTALAKAENLSTD